MCPDGFYCRKYGLHDMLTLHLEQLSSYMNGLYTGTHNCLISQRESVRGIGEEEEKILINAPNT
jgi:hypothetical protein